MTPTFSGEVQLAGWSESHNGGCKVTFWLADASDLDAFRTMTARKGNTAGQRLACVLVEIGDDELPVVQKAESLCTSPERVQKTPESAHVKGGDLAKSAGIMCSEPSFQRFANAHGFNSAELVYYRCGISSRRELDHDSRAAVLYGRLREQYREWQAECVV
jgi:hypothetical protein